LAKGDVELGRVICASRAAVTDPLASSMLAIETSGSLPSIGGLLSAPPLRIKAFDDLLLKHSNALDCLAETGEKPLI